MQSILIVLLVMVIAINIAITVVILRRKGGKEGSGEGLKLILEQVNELGRTVDRKVGDLTKTVDTKIHESSQSMQDSMRVQLSESSKLIREVTVGLTRLGETNKQVINFTDQLGKLQDMLKNPKQRGIIGEYYLETLLKNVLGPDQYKMQYPFKNGVIVDAAVFVKDKIIPIDSKFSYENYNKLVGEHNEIVRDGLEKDFRNDLKIRIQETAKYIQPAEGTMDFAFMFIPHEAIYYDLLINKIGEGETGENLIQYAARKFKVIIVSPTSFLAYLQTVLQALNAMQIEEKAKDIVKRVGELGVHMKRYEEYHGKLGVSLSTVINHYNSSSKELKKVDKDTYRITGESPGLGVDQPVLEKPDMEF